MANMTFFTCNSVWKDACNEKPSVIRDRKLAKKYLKLINLLKSLNDSVNIMYGTDFYSINTFMLDKSGNLVITYLD